MGDVCGILSVNRTYDYCITMGPTSIHPPKNVWQAAVEKSVESTDGRKGTEILGGVRRPFNRSV